MKRIYFIITLLTVVSLGLKETFAQVPQSFLYQAEARDSRGKILVEDELSVKVTILQNNLTEVYKETHAVKTDMNGLFNLRVGEGDFIELGDFSTLDWGIGTYFLNIQIAAGASTNYTDMGTTQLLSVPYALHAETVSKSDDADADPTNELQSLSISGDQLSISDGNSISLAFSRGGNITVYSSAEIAELTPVPGETVLNTTENLLLIYNGTIWLPFNPVDNCWPQPTIAHAGDDQSFSDGTTTAILSANTPEPGLGTGLWNIISGEGGSFYDATSPSTTFIGADCTSYFLQWTISTNCNSSADTLQIKFNQKTTVANAGEDQIVSNGTTTSILSANTPEVGHGIGEWTVLSGKGGSFTDPSNPTTSFNGIFNESYNLRWTISTSCESSSDEVSLLFWNNSMELTDIEGNVYQTVLIGNQIWMAENLKSTKLKDGTDIPLITDNTEWSSLGIPGYSWYNNDFSTYAETYGALYNWYTVGTGILCPEGWHVPSDAEWAILEEYLADNGYGYEGSGNDIAKSIAAKTNWQTSSTIGVPGNDPENNNGSGFSGLPGASRSSSGSFWGIGLDGYWWSSTEYDSYTALYRDLYYGSAIVYHGYHNKVMGKSVRCVKD